MATIIRNTIKNTIIKSTISTAILYSIMNVSQASSLLVKVHDYSHELPKSVSNVCDKKDNCPEIEISYLNSNKAWVNKIINQKINAFIAGNSAYPAVKFEEYSIKVPVSVKQSLDQFATLQIEDRLDGTGFTFNKSVEPAYLGHTVSLELFEISGYDYLGGAHGLGYVTYSTLDTDTKEEITLDDILLNSKKPVLSKLVEAEFDEWIIKQGMSPSEHKASWEFVLTDNMTFTAEGLHFLYQPYELAYYAAGMIELSVSYDELNDVIKPKYLSAGRQLAD